MATRNILQLPVRIGLTGAEWLEVAVSNPPGSLRVTSAQLALLSMDVSPTGPLGVAVDAPSGTQNNYTVGGEFNPLIGFIDITPIANCNITGLQAGVDGQLVIITNLSPNFTATLNALNGGSLLANQFRMVADFILPQNNGKSFKYSATIGKWVAM